jgi:methyl-accepting chemotaxis protein
MLNNLSLRAKLFVGFGSLLVFIGAVGYAGVYSLNKIIPIINSMYVDRLAPAGQMGLLMRDWYKVRANMYAHMLERDPATRSTHENEMNDLLREIDETEKEYEATFLIPEEKSTLARYKASKNAYLQQRQKVLDLSTQGNPDAAYAASKESRPMLLETINSADRLLAIQIEVGKQLLDESTATEGQVKMIIYSITGSAIVAGILLALLIARSIANPVRKLQEAADKVSAGHLDTRIHNDSTDEIGRLSKNFNSMINNIRTSSEESAQREQYLQESVNNMLGTMEQFSRGDLTVRLKVQNEDAIGMLFDGFNTTVEHIRQTIMNVSRATETASTAANELSATSEEMSSVAHDQAQKTTHVASSVEEMLQTVRTNAHATTQAASLAASNGRNAKIGGEIMEKTLIKMRDIADVVTRSANTVQRLGESSANIGEIVSVIDEIADQTNLLALNAAIEAARAGEQGRGFAVVADEVRKLAERTGIATKQISDTIRKIQSDTENAVKEMQRGSKEVGEGMNLADEAGQALGSIVQGTSQVQDMITQIAAATEEQAQTSEQIAGNVTSMAAATEQTTHALGEIVSTIGSLSEMTENLRNMISRFHTDTHSAMQHPTTQKHIMANSSRKQIGMG